MTDEGLLSRALNIAQILQWSGYCDPASVASYCHRSKKRAEETKLLQTDFDEEKVIALLHR